MDTKHAESTSLMYSSTAKQDCFKIALQYLYVLKQDAQKVPQK